MEAMGMMRDLDQIRERDDRSESSKLVLIALGGLATACVLFAVGIMIGRDADTARTARHEDPLARLDALAGQSAAPSAPIVSYQDRLLDPPAARDHESAAAADLLAPVAAAEPVAVPSAAAPHRTVLTNAALPPAVAAPRAIIAPSEPRRVTASLPASALVESTGRVRDVAPVAQLPIAPANQARITPVASTPSAPAGTGSEGAFTLQISSFRQLAAAQQFATRLRERGYHAFVTSGPSGASAMVWHRVRIGPFASLREASRYRADFESRERLPTFVVRRDEAPHHGA